MADRSEQSEADDTLQATYTRLMRAVRELADASYAHDEALLRLSKRAKAHA